MKSLKRRFLDWMSLYPPFIGAGIRVRRIEGGFRAHMPLRFYNRNYYGTHFGGSLYAMCDPFFTLELTERLGSGYYVWDKAASIQFLKPGQGRVTAEFKIGEARVEEILRLAAGGEKVEPRFEAEVLNPDGEVAARVEKLLYVKKKPARRS